MNFLNIKCIFQTLQITRLFLNSFKRLYFFNWFAFGCYHLMLAIPIHSLTNLIFCACSCYVIDIELHKLIFWLALLSTSESACDHVMWFIINLAILNSCRDKNTWLSIFLSLFSWTHLVTHSHKINLCHSIPNTWQDFNEVLSRKAGT